jgi:hypothetical protein
MVAPRLLHDLSRVGLVLFEALERLREGRDKFVTEADGDQVRQLEASITRFRFFAERLERELNYLEYLVVAEPRRPSAASSHS